MSDDSKVGVSQRFISYFQPEREVTDFDLALWWAQHPVVGDERDFPVRLRDALAFIRRKRLRLLPGGAERPV